MGSNWVKFRKAVEKGEQNKVLDLYYKYPKIRRKLNANLIINEETLDTFMHVCAKNGMVEFLKLLLYENEGDPNKLNRFKQTVLHKVCEGTKDSDQYECMQLIIQWQTASNFLPSTSLPELSNKNLKKKEEKSVTKSKSSIVKFKQNEFVEINVNAKDENQNTPLHYAALNNLPTCVQTLVAHGAYLFVENNDRLTACDLAENCGCKDIAIYLESKMLFSKDDELDTCEDIEAPIRDEKQNYGLGIQDLQEEKNKVVLETSKILRCNIFMAEILLKKHEWSKENLLKAWVEDPKKCCEKCGIPVEAIEQELTNSENSENIDIIKFKNEKLYEDSNTIIARRVSGRYTKMKNNVNIPEISKTNNSICKYVNSEPKKDIFSKNDIINDNESNKIRNSLTRSNKKKCFICLNDFDIQEKHESNVKNDDLIKIICGHQFCGTCWEQYLTMKIEEGNVNDIICPAVDCYAIIPRETVQKLVSKETIEKYLHFDLKAFVDTNPAFKWCPYPNCGLAIRNPSLIHETNEDNSDNLINKKDQKTLDYSRSVDCGNGHYFCWNCLQDGHEPASCQNWKDWFKKILEIKPDELVNTNQTEEISANYLWLVSNSKKCPNENCNAPIQKNEGCNHVKCYKCKYDFCWICLEPWKKHSSATGGYFQCNRFETSNKILQKEKITVAEAEEAHQKAVELNRFVHYYTRFKNHELSYKIEEPLLATAKTKFELLIARYKQESSSQPFQKSPSLSTKGDIKNENSSSEKDLNNIAIEKNVTPDEKITSTEQINYDKNLIKEEKKYDPTALVFIEDAIKELLKARRILRCSYVYGYFLDTFGHKKFIFEFIQTEFEEFTENLSQIIARPHLKTPINKIIRFTILLKRKRVEFLDTITKGLNSFSDTPPTLKKYSRQRWKYLLKDNIQNDDEFKNNVALSLKELDPKNPWIIDKKGRHTNLLALLNDWPELEQELDKILVPSKDKNDTCTNKNCKNPKAVNNLSGSVCNYCSIKCMRDDHENFVLYKNSSNKLALNSALNVKLDDIQKEVKNFKTTFIEKKKSTSFESNNGINKSFSGESSNCSSETQFSNNKNLDYNKKKQNKDKLECYYAVVPYEPIFLDSKLNDICTIIRNMDNFRVDENCDKISKVFNFDVKIKHKTEFN